MSYDVDAVRAEFPILSREVQGRPLAYLDNAASAQKPRAVIEAMSAAMEGEYANVHRGLHTLANETTERFERARKTVARFLNAPSTDEIVFTSGGTDAMNLVAGALGAAEGEIGIGEGDEIVLSVMEHHSNIVPWHLLRERNGAVLKWIDVDADGRIDLDALDALMTDRTKLVAITHVSNVLGARSPVKEIARTVHDRGALLFVDGCQGAVHGRVDVQDLDCDFYVVTAHKLYGPTGVGALYGKRDVLAQLPPFKGGGEMIDVVEKTRVTYNDPPHRFEAGTPPILEAIGFGAALEWMEARGVKAIAEHEAGVLAYANERLSALNWVEVYGQAPDKAAIIAFNVDGAHAHDVATVLDRKGVAVRAGHHCCQPLMTHLGVTATARASMAAYTTRADIDQFVDGLKSVRKLFG
ncbi:MAG: cysteine desulfurase [Pseudomonadota bacterium]